MVKRDDTWEFRVIRGLYGGLGSLRRGPCEGDMGQQRATRR